MTYEYNIGIDLGGTNIAAGIVTRDGKIVSKYTAKTDVSSEEAVISGLADAVRALKEESGLPDGAIGTLGVACPGIVDSTRGIVERSANLPLLGTHVAEALAARTGFDVSRVKTANDADAAALGEFHVGSGRGVRDFLMITIGTGIGGGFISGGKILTGRNHAGGEFGHTVIVFGGEPCGCGRRGCAEKYCSAKALVRLTGEALADCERRGVHTLMADMVERDGRISGRTAFRAADEGDPEAAAVVDLYIRYLACALTNYINVFQPEILAIGGGISNEGEKLLAPLRRVISEEIYNRYQPDELKTKIRRAELGGDAGIIGAAML